MGKQFVSFRYMKSLEKAINHVKYIAFRDRESEKGLFNDRSDHAEVEPFLESLKDKRTSHKDVAKVHTLLFSMSKQEWDRGKYHDGDWKTMVRNVMKDWQLKNNITVDWVAAVHGETGHGHPHVHVVIKSVQRDANGIERRLNVKLSEEREWFKEVMKEEKQRMVHLRGGREPLTREQWIIERRRALQKPAMARSVLNNINNRIQQRMKEVEMKRQWERDMDR